MSAVAASLYLSQWIIMPLLVSIRKPMTMGCDCSWLKKSIFCSLFSSKILKSSRVRLETKRPFSSVTVTGTMTSFTETLMGAWALATEVRARANVRKRVGIRRGIEDSRKSYSTLVYLAAGAGHDRFGVVCWIFR